MYVWVGGWVGGWVCMVFVCGCGIVWVGMHVGVWVCTLGCKCTVYGIVCRCMYAYGCVCVLLCMWVRVGVIKVVCMCGGCVVSVYVGACGGI